MNINDYILSNFFIDPDTGIITRYDRANSNGSYDKDGYLIYKIKGKQYKSHRLAWFLYYKEWPIGEIDHINRIRTDNSKINLRITDRVGNIKNTTKKINKETGVVGVYIDKTKGLKKKYAFRCNRKTLRFATLEDALNYKTHNNETVNSNSK